MRPGTLLSTLPASDVVYAGTDHGYLTADTASGMDDWELKDKPSTLVKCAEEDKSVPSLVT